MSEIYVKNGIARDDEGNVSRTSAPDGFYTASQFARGGYAKNSGSSFRGGGHAPRRVSVVPDLGELTAKEKSRFDWVRGKQIEAGKSEQDAEAIAKRHIHKLRGEEAEKVRKAEQEEFSRKSAEEQKDKHTFPRDGKIYFATSYPIIKDFKKSDPYEKVNAKENLTDESQSEDIANWVCNALRYLASGDDWNETIRIMLYSGDEKLDEVSVHSREMSNREEVADKVHKAVEEAKAKLEPAKAPEVSQSGSKYPAELGELSGKERGRFSFVKKSQIEQGKSEADAIRIATASVKKMRLSEGLHESIISQVDSLLD